ncbi:hypothetical protein [Streptomyces sp. NRRL S-646]|uniref:hypothetical protein n=1 Tax=Streptomyces sp. NRRL S-646 TaxID=1463917 RepID=UPI001902C14D|nr:hypothetical protein [Streptomyces sp. NRRL S-646]
MSLPVARRRGPAVRWGGLPGSADGRDEGSSTSRDADRSASPSPSPSVSSVAPTAAPWYVPGVAGEAGVCSPALRAAESAGVSQGRMGPD